MQRLAAAIVLLLSICPHTAPAAPPDDAPAAAGGVATALAQRVAKLPAGVQVGVVVQDTATGQVWFRHNPDLLLKPASVLKLFTTAAALQRFGPQFAFRTSLYWKDGEALIIGGGDPSIGDERLAERRKEPPDAVLRRWAERIAAAAAGAAVRKIAIDDSVFDQQLRHPDWPADQHLAWYQAPVGGLNLNDNCVDVGFRIENGRAIVLARPALPAAFFENRLSVGGKHAPRLTRDFESDLIELSGTVNKSGSLEAMTVNRPTLFFGHALQQALANRGAPAGEVVRRRVDPRGAAPGELLEQYATPLPDVLWRCNTFSQNLFAECLLKSLAAYERDGARSQTPGGWDAGHAVLRQELAALGVDLSTAVLRDGSGLSHQNRVTAAQVVGLLSAMRRHPHAAVFIESLAAAGEEGSMKRRYGDPELRGRVRAKTGTISGVSALAGYVTRDDGTVLAFAVLIGGGNDGLTLDVCRILARP